MPTKVKIVEVGPRDGLQNEKTELGVATKVSLIQQLAAAGLKNIEVGAFVSPKWVPQMQSSDKVIARVYSAQKKGKITKDVHFSALVPNKIGMELAQKTAIQEVAVFGASSESFSKRNINCSISESFQRFEQVIRLAKKNKIKVRGYLSTAFGCPYEGAVPQARVVRLVRQLLDLGVYEVSVGDTIGVATPKQVKSLVGKIKKNSGLKKVAMHFHDTRGTALANVYSSFELGVRTFDSSIGGLGGCPYAKGASGNLATEDLIYMLEGMGVRTGVDVDKLVKTKVWLERQIGRDLPSHVGRSGLPVPSPF